MKVRSFNSIEELNKFLTEDLGVPGLTEGVLPPEVLEELLSGGAQFNVHMDDNSVYIEPTPSGGSDPEEIYDSPKDEVHEAELFFVETDFGNHMKLTWGEVMEMYTVAGWQDYELWRARRDELRQQTPFNEIGFEHYDPTFLGNTFQP
jgi:hypothetical protein